MDISSRAWLTIGALSVGIALALLFRLASDPNGAILLPGIHAQWIEAGRPFSLKARPTSETRTRFRRRFFLRQKPHEAVLVVKVFRAGDIDVNGQRFSNLETVVSGAPWFDSEYVEISDALVEGVNEIAVVVTNPKGPPALFAYSKELDLRTDESWETSSNSSQWVAAHVAGQPGSIAIRETFPSAKRSLVRVAPFFVGIFFVALGGRFLLKRKLPEAYMWLLTASRVRYLMLAAWFVLCANNLDKIPIYIGFDVQAHYAYVLHIVAHHRLPLATEGWQMFQSPLYYLLSAPLYVVSAKNLGPAQALVILRLLPMVCGLALIELSYRSSQIVFAEHGGLRLVSTVVGGSMPMMFYMSQVAGNEPLAAALTAALVYACLRYLTRPVLPTSPRPALVIGTLFGLSLLSKVTVVLLLPVLGWVLWQLYGGAHHTSAVIRFLKGVATSCACVVMLAGWYFARNWIALGKPIIGGWDETRGIDWWQDPGYRLLGDLLRFGDSLHCPIYASIFGFWDGLYSTLWLDGYLSSIISRAHVPPWNYPFMLSLSLLALPLTAALMWGVVQLPWRSCGAPKRALFFAAYGLLCYLSGMVYLFLKLPIYSTVKATYALGMTPCLGVFTAVGLRAVLQRPFARAVAGAYLTTWCVFVYIAFFIL